MSARGFTLLELVVVVAVVGIMTGFALDRLPPLIGRAERAAFVQVQAQLRSALLLEAAERVTKGESAALAELSAVNPMALLLDAPANYVGAIDAPGPVLLPPRSWYYDVRNGRLVYKVGKHARFEPLRGPRDRVEFVVEFVYRDRDGDDVFNPSRDDFHGLRLSSVYAYRWPD